jgi:hypothetical protein
VIGVRPPASGEAQLWLFSEPSYSSLLASDASGTGVQYVVADFNHIPPTAMFPRFRRSAGTGPIDCHVQDGDILPFTEGGTEIVNKEWETADVVAAFDVFLDPGTRGGQQIRVDVADQSGALDLGVALFKSSGATYYAGAASAVAASDVSGVGGTETITYNATSPDWYGLIIHSNNDAGGTYQIRLLDPEGITSVDGAPGDEDSKPLALDLRLATANPFTDAATLQLTLPEETFVDLTVYDAQGRRVDSLVRDRLGRGVHDIRWSGERATGSGIYLARLVAGREERTVKLIRMR